jgi:hypothetical protein
MDLERLRAPFPREDVEWRAQTVTKDGNKALAFPYIDARAVSDRLDEVCGPENWQCRYAFSPDGKKTLCEIGIRCGEEWVWKADGAGDTDVEAEKGALSDAFKRAGVKWGIARYLYSLPQVWVPCKSELFKDKMQFRGFTADPWTYVPRDADRPANTSPERKVGNQAGRAEDGGAKQSPGWMQARDTFRALYKESGKSAEVADFYGWCSEDDLAFATRALRSELNPVP